MSQQSKPFKRSIKLVGHYMELFGFNSYTASVEPLPKEHYGKCWAASQWSIDDEWAIFYFMPDGVMPESVHELTVIHEVAHGLIEMGKFGSGAIEQACWRIARAHLPDAQTPQLWVHTTLDPKHRIEGAFDDDD